MTAAEIQLFTCSALHSFKFLNKIEPLENNLKTTFLINMEEQTTLQAQAL